MVLKICTYLFLIVIFTSGTIDSVQQRNQKKIDKTLAAIWPEANIEIEPMPDAPVAENEKAFKVLLSSEHSAYFILAQGRSKFDAFDYMVVFDRNGVILKPKILVYREDYGGEIASTRWLKQFIGKSSEAELSLGKDIQNIAGATISCESASRGFKQASESIQAIIDGRD